MLKKLQLRPEVKKMNKRLGRHSDVSIRGARGTFVMGVNSCPML